MMITIHTSTMMKMKILLMKMLSLMLIYKFEVCKSLFFISENNILYKYKSKYVVKLE